MTLNSTGLGIGTTSPTTPLEVNGIVRIDTSGNTAFYEGDGVRLFGSQNYRFRNTSGNVRAIINVTSGNFSLYNASNNITNLIATAGDSYFNGGNVGIGETSPDQKLNVREDGGSDVFRGIEVHNNNQSQARAGICFKAYDWVQSAIWHGRGTSTAYNGALVLGTNPNTTDLTVSGVTGRMWILNNGNIGIRTDAPTNPLNINFSPNGIANITTGNNSTAWNTSSAIMLNGASNSNGLGFGVSGTANDRKSWIQSGHPQQQYANYLGALAINPLGGDVGIGTTSPTAKLDINGTVRYRGNTYSQLTYQVSGNYSANTWYTIATTATLTEQGIYILVAYVEDFTAGGSNYYIHACSTNFFWDRTSTNRTTAFNFPALLGTGHATGSLPLIRITQELGTAGAQSKIQWQTPYTYTGLNPGLSGKKLVFYFKRIGG